MSNFRDALSRGVAGAIDTANRLELRLRGELEHDADELLLPVTGPGNVFTPVEPTPPNVTPKSTPFVTTAAALGAHFLHIRHAASVSDSLTLTGTIRLRTGDLVSIGENGLGLTFNTSNDRSIRTAQLPIPADCEVVSLRLACASGFVLGQIYAHVQRLILMQNGIDFVLVQSYVQNYLTNFQPIFWPGGASRENSLAGEVTPISVVGPTIQGAPSVLAVPVGAQWEVLGVHAVIATDGTAGNRGPAITLGPLNSSIVATGDSIAPNSTHGLTVARDLQFQHDAVNGFISAPLMDDIRIGPLGQLILSAFNFSAGDIWSGVTWRVNERLVFQS